MPWISVKTTSETKALLSKEKIQTLFIKDDLDIHSRLFELDAVDSAGGDRISLEHVVDDIIRPGQILELGGGQPIEVLDAPGHCRGGIALWQPESKVLFCSDYLGFHLPPDRFVTNFYVDYDGFLKTFECLSGLEPTWICPGHCGAYAGKDAARYIDLSRAELKWVADYIADASSSPEKIEAAKEILFDRYYMDEATMFSEESTRHCMDLLIRRILSSKTHASSQAAEKP
jgi:glyoxylase-like metal-dependent hydrolase (beta-lactamase superfamily II)